MRPVTRENERSLDLTGTGYCASLNFRRTARAVTRLYDAAMQKSGMRSTQFAILVGIAKKQPIAIGALGEILMIDQTTLARSLRLLRKERLVSASERSTMRRRFLEVTPKGERALARALPYWQKMQANFQNAVGRTYWNDLRSELERLAKLATSLEAERARIAAEEL
jgi:DNA-binding MarR family transcriptional regulator